MLKSKKPAGMTTAMTRAPDVGKPDARTEEVESP